MIELELSPAHRPGYYRAAWDGLALTSSRQPFYDAARVLLGMGAAPGEELAARWAGSSIVALRSTVGDAARWVVEESDRTGLRLRAYRSPEEKGLRPALVVGLGA